LVILALANDELCGFICCCRDWDPVWGSLIDNLHVAKHYRGNGLGSLLLEEAAAWVRSYGNTPSLYLWVYEANESARRYYGRRGGRPVEIIDDKTPDGGSARSIRIHWPDALILPTGHSGK
jgi:GNAT superfamily N-acetyltransferase